ncbi:hypothetical protein HYH02_008345 [Chlamydomonas schloesseri]|uniref:Nudix hydrolase domain-containing protein n=1 Tax=Chlamydomonas schloesseri TaxID=2026947 RepID=A0A835WG26_9CHLO|nr:hypothetical protein HYH02_008345 [Chlamydomonas schloesseri]|eukprot:KAG2446785.1 hypothetical protein HYH02_008345 [Chlamydomonas schloesseri]
MHALPRAKPPTQALGCLALHTRGVSSCQWTYSTHAPLAPPSPSGSPSGRGAQSSIHADASVASARPNSTASASIAHPAGAAPGVRCWAVCSGPSAPPSLATGARSAASGRRAACPAAAAGPLSSAWLCRCVPGPRLGPRCSKPAETRTDRHLTPGAEARGGGGGGVSCGGPSRTGGSSSCIGSTLLASVAASAAAASVGASRALGGAAVLGTAAVQLRPAPSSAPYLRAPARSSQAPVGRPAVLLGAALPASASVAGGGTSSPTYSPSSSGSGGSSRRSPLVFVGSGSSSSSSSSGPSGRAVAAAGSTQMATADVRTEAAVGAPGMIPSSWPPASERLEVVAARLRAQPHVQHKPVSDRAAAVLVGLFEDSSGVVRVLLTQRSSRLKSHRGEVCLPGGKRDEEDADDAATALREANEELGLDPSAATVLCCLPPVLSKHHLSVTPVLALLDPGAVPAPHPAEVDAAFTVPLAVFLGTYADPRRAAAAAAGGGVGGGGGGGTGGHEQQAGASSVQAPADDGADGSGRRTRRRRSAAAAPPADAEPKPLSWRPPPAAAATSKAAAAAATATATAGAGGESGAGGGRPVGSDCVYGNAVHEYRDISWGEHEYRIHSFQYGDFDVWGLTATICIAAARLALGREPSFQERCPGGQHYSCFYWDGSALRVRPEADISHACPSMAAAATAPAATEAGAAAEVGPAAAVAAGRGQGGRAPGEGGVMQLPSREDLAAAADVAVEAVEEEVIIAAAGVSGA